MAAYPRHVETRIRLALRDTRVVAITGPRQSGKTTLARRFARQGRSYVTLDDPATLAAAKSDPVRSYENWIERLSMRYSALLTFFWQSNAPWTRTGVPVVSS
ncbi:AAA family ATPase [Peristeroidobacter soli]|uniref:AAA family ATPase n=1 Tax=Peristeroidobacter soli TaxID=2497877 RepID=UPI001C378CB9